MNMDYIELSGAVIEVKKERDDYLYRRNRVLGLSPKFFLTVFSLAFLYFFFAKDFKIPFLHAPTTTVEHFIVFEKPDDESRTLLNGTGETELEILDKTKYYYKVRINKNDKELVGYIRKREVNR